MSAKYKPSKKTGCGVTSLATIFLILAVTVPSALQARSIIQGMTYFLADPMKTQPTVLAAGVVLPGDTVTYQCSSKALPDVLHLSQAVEFALCNNAQLRVTWASIKLQAGVAGEARSTYLPTMSATLNRLRTQTSFPDGQSKSTLVNGNAVNVALNWRLYDFGTRAANRRAADSLLLAALLHHDAQLQTTLGETIQAYFDVQSAQATWMAKEESQKIASDTLASAERRERLGAVARRDTLQATTALARASLEKNRAEGNYRTAMATLMYAMGVPAMSDVRIEQEIDIVSDPLELNNLLDEQAKEIGDRLRDTKQSHPKILAAREEWRAALNHVTSAQADGLPTIDATGNYYQNAYPGQGLSTTRSRTNTVGIAINIPIFDGFSRTYKIRQAQAQAEQRLRQAEDTEHRVLSEVVKAHAEANASNANLQASNALFQAALQAQAATRRKYDKGAADILEILATQQALADARLERIRSLAEWRSTRLRLMASVGVLGTQSVATVSEVRQPVRTTLSN